MASDESQNQYHGGMTEWKTAEGISIDIPYRETESQIITDIVGGLRSGLTYGGAANIRELQRKLDYIRISWASKIENLAHMAHDQKNSRYFQTKDQKRGSNSKRCTGHSFLQSE
jgi:hypothetical protein